MKLYIDVVECPKCGQLTSWQSPKSKCPRCKKWFKG